MRNDQPKAKLAKLITTKIMTDVHTYVSDSILVEKTRSSISCENGFPCATSSNFLFFQRIKPDKFQMKECENGCVRYTCVAAVVVEVRWASFRPTHYMHCTG